MVNVATQTDKEACFDLEVRVKKTENRIAYRIYKDSFMPHAACRKHKTHVACGIRMPRVRIPSFIVILSKILVVKICHETSGPILTYDSMHGYRAAPCAARAIKSAKYQALSTASLFSE